MMKILVYTDNMRFKKYNMSKLNKKGLLEGKKVRRDQRSPIKK